MTKSTSIRLQRPGRYLIATAALAAVTLAGCSGGDAGGSATTVPAASPPSSAAAVPSSQSMAPSSGGSSSPTGQATPESGAAALLEAARTALAQLPDSTLISIETERNGTAWEVQLITADGTEQEMELSADGTEVVTQAVAKNEDIADKSKHLDRLKASKLNYEEAVQKILPAVPNGNITELNLDSEQGITVWEADVVDESNVKHSVQIDAASGAVLRNSTS